MFSNSFLVIDSYTIDNTISSSFSQKIRVLEREGNLLKPILR